MECIADDLVLLAIHPEKGYLTTSQNIRFGLTGVELLRLAAVGRIGIRAHRIIVLDRRPTGAPELDTALSSIAEAKRPPRLNAWIARGRPGIISAYVDRLIAGGGLEPQAPQFLKSVRFKITDPGRAAGARHRLDAVALTSSQVDNAQAALGGLAHAILLDRFVYPGWANRAVRWRLEDVGKGRWTRPGMVAVAGTEPAATGMTRAVTSAVACAVARKARHAGLPPGAI
jgi:hypothetical protein